MKRQILFIQGAGKGAYKEDQKLANSLRNLLGDLYEVRYPEMPNEMDPDYGKWVSQIKKELSALNDTPVLVGHSIGGSILLKFLAETKLKTGVAAIFVVAAPFWGGDGGWTYDGYETLALPKESDSVFPDNVPVFLYHSNDDEVVPFEHLALYGKKFPLATVRVLEGRGHQLNSDLSEVADDLKALQQYN